MPENIVHSLQQEPFMWNLKNKLRSYLPNIHTPFFLSRSIYVFLFLCYFFIKILLVVGMNSTTWSDSGTYLGMATYSIFDPNFYAGQRPFVVPLLYKLLSVGPNTTNFDLVVITQILISIFCWTFLASTATRRITISWLKPCMFGSILAFGLSREIVQWDLVVLSESVSISMTVLFLATWMWLLEKWEWKRVGVLFFVAILYTFCRDTNAYLVLIIAILLIPPALIYKKQYFVISGFFLCLFLLSNGSANHGKRWNFPFRNVVGQRILSDPEYTEYFQKKKMPVSATLMTLVGKTQASQEWQALSQKNDSDLNEFVHWSDRRGKKAYVRFLLSHPVYLLYKPIKFLHEILIQCPDWYSPNLFLPLGNSLTSITYPNNLTTLLLWTAACLGLFGSLMASGKLQTIWTIPALMILLTYPHGAVVWHGDSMEVARHCLLVGVQFRLGLWLLSLFMIDAVVHHLRYKDGVAQLEKKDR
jgi:hypothetical protein